MKKLLFAVIFTLLISAASFGADFKLGAGGGLDFQGVYNMGLTNAGGDYRRTIDNNNHFGLSLFFDATYAEVDFLFSYGMFSWHDSNGAYSGNEFTLEISLMGKYPFYLERFTFFPLLGISGKFYLGGETAGAGNNAIRVTDTGGLGLVGGIGADFPLTERLYLRGEFLYGMKLPFYPTDSEGNRPGHGPRIKVGVGYIFF